MFMLPTISLKIERWKFNKEYGIYVSTLGNFKDRHKRRLPIKVSQCGGYRKVMTETAQYKSVHRLVMLTWKPIPNAEELTVDHLNHNKRDNSLANLEWVSEEENLKRAKEDFLPIARGKGKINAFLVDGVKCSSKKSAMALIYAAGCTKSERTLNEIFDNIITGKNTSRKKIISVGNNKKVLLEGVVE